MSNCTLCDLDTPSPPITDPDVDGEYCCRGCLAVARTVDDVAAADAETASAQLREATDAADDLAGYDEQYLSVSGMHCSTCEAFLESTATSHEGIGAVSASYATDTLKIHYDPDQLAADELPDLVSGYGYEATERSVEADRELAGDIEVVKFLVGGGLFGMMTMLWYVLFLYPTYFDIEPLVDLGGFDGLYLFAQLWLLASLVLFYTGYPILRGAYVSLRAGQPNMDLLVSVAALGSYSYSTLAMVMGRTDLYFDVTVAIILVVTVGNYYESTIKGRASDLLTDLTTIQVDEARRPDGSTVPVSAIEPDDELLVRPGDRIPVDGVVESGVAAVDEALVTGESVPRTKRPGDDVRGGTVVTDQPLTIRAGEAAESTLDRIVELLWEIQSGSPGVQRFADKLATIFVPLVLTVGVLAAGWTLLSGGSPTAALLVGLTVVIASCPCALGLATPLAVAQGIQTAASRGMVVASSAIFETAADVDVIALDKTGTLTSGEMQVTEVAGDDPNDLLSTAAALERASAHPIADAIVAAASTTDATPAASEHATDGGELVSATATETIGGVDTVETFDTGVRGRVAGREVTVGHSSLFEGWADPDDYHTEADRLTEQGDVAVVVGWDETIQGVIGVGDEPKADWKAVVDSLADGDREIVVLTGDDSAATRPFETHPAVDHVFAGVPPEAKAETIRRLQSQGRVAMIGDGSNDAPALAAADLGVALATGTKLATDAGDVIVVDGDLSAVPRMFTIASKTRSRIRQNLAWAFCYNGVAIPLAATGLLNPLFAAVAMGASSLLVVLNSTLRPLD
ncbi:heavy metal translocating P-type ATPase [Halohasta litorea]|uniref:Heavy metal translocating P-type ATPase n=1 Tax=Halohasta litorea TaxID=869891 RepID=A0ABD6D2J8_9EURY|nr:cation-translocating P-type ATPase [Halohasta litorea]